ncbi:MAG: PilW family protein [Gammaproteobacteria bacterium]|nr:PilW family protein [Gammaproteobacteria bacterium]MDH3561763.1 PilW family protein [Gammaproteobacteria bacterium]
MKRRGPTLQNTYSQRGFSIVELMVAAAVSLVLMAGVTHVYVGSKSTYRVQEGLSRVQENGRFALELLGRKIRMAGYQGCANPRLLTPSIIIASPPPEAVFDLKTVVIGYDNVAAGNGFGSSGARPGTDVIEMRGASASGMELDGNMATDNANLQFTTNSENIVAGDYLFISDCETADIFQATSVSATSDGKITVAHANSSNTTNRLSKAYLADAFMLKQEFSTFYIMDTGRTNQTGAPIYSLYETDIKGVEREFISGIDDMQITYGLDTSPSPDSTAEVYRDAATITAADAWQRVVSVRLALLLSTPEDVGPEPVAYTDLSGTLISNPGDRRLRRRFVETVTIRSRAL